METLFIQLNRDRESAQWQVLNEQNQPHASVLQGPLSRLKEFTRQRRVVCAINSDDLLLTEAKLPASRNRRRLLQAIPFALEDELAEDIEQLHFAIGKETQIKAATTEEGDEAPASNLTAIPVAIIDKTKMREWLDLLQEAGIKPHVLLPDILTVPLQEQGWSIMLNEEIALLRTGTTTGFTCEPETLGLYLDSALSQNEENQPEHIHILNHNGQMPELDWAHEGIELQRDDAEQDWLTTLVRGYDKANTINLLQGEFSYREEYGKLFKPWRLPGILLAVLLLLGLGGKAVENYRLQSQLDELETQIIDVYKQVFPNSRNTTEPRRQLQAKLDEFGASGNADSQFLKLLHTAARRIKGSPDTSINGITFDGERLDVDLTVKEVVQMDQLKQTLEQDNVTVEINSISAEGDKVSGQLRIRQ